MTQVLVIPGDGIGPEVILPTVDLIKSITTEIEFYFEEAGKSRFEKTGKAFSDDLLENARKSDAILFGATTSVRDERYRSPILSLRKELDLFANVRSIKSLSPASKNIDILIIRENTEGLYTGIEDRDLHGVTTFRRVTSAGCARIVKFAFDYCAKHRRKKLLCVHKANVLRLSDGLFLDTFNSEAERNREIQSSDALVDSTAMKMVMTPCEFDAIVTLNLYGDILSDLGAGLIGGLGFLPSANYGTENALFEPAHGSALDIVGKGIANPFAAMLSGAMMLEYLEYRDEAEKMITSIENTLKKSKNIFFEQGRCKTKQAFDSVSKDLRNSKSLTSKRSS